MPDYTIGVSAGLAYGVSYLSRQSRRNLKLTTTYANDPRYMGLRNLLDPKNRAYFGLKFAYETIPQTLLPFDYDALEAYPGEAEVVVTDLETGLAEYLPLPRRDCPNLPLIASCAIPMMFPAIEYQGHRYYDGGCADAIPWKHALEAGCDRVVVILTRERDYRKETDRSFRVLEQTFRKHPAFVETMRHRAERYNASREELFAQEQAGNLIVIAPEDTLGCSRTERDTEILRGLWQEGYFAGRRCADRVREFWTAE